MEVCNSHLFSHMISPSLESIPAKEDKVISFCTPFSVTTELSESTNWESSLSISMGMFWVKFRMFLIIRVYGSFSANTLWIISIFRFYGNFGVSKFILRFYRSCGRNDIVRFCRRTATQVHETCEKNNPENSGKSLSKSHHQYRKTLH